MKRLSENWVTEKNNDKEYKQYILLAYLKEVEKHFRNTKLYPHYPELKYHHKLLTEFAQNTTDLLLNFPQKPVGMDLEKYSLAYENEIENPKMINEINEIVEFSIPKIENFLEEGNQILDFIEQRVNVEPIGIVPLEKDEGYFLLVDHSHEKMLVYQYHITLFDKSDAAHRKIKTRYMMSFKKTYRNTMESIKSTLIGKNQSLPNPATFSIESSMPLPLNETYLPIAKMMLAQHIDGKDDQQNLVN
jgi:hypothetical protein